MSPSAPVETVDPAAAVHPLQGWLARRLPADAVAWLDGEIGRQREKLDERRLGMALGLVGRRVGAAIWRFPPRISPPRKPCAAAGGPTVWGPTGSARHECTDHANERK
jgi:hypothetical protein